MVEAGQVIQVHYRDGEWHERLLLKRGTPFQMEKLLGEKPSSDHVWWVVTPDADVFPDLFERDVPLRPGRQCLKAVERQILQVPQQRLEIAVNVDVGKDPPVAQLS